MPPFYQEWIFHGAKSIKCFTDLKCTHPLQSLLVQGLDFWKVHLLHSPYGLGDLDWSFIEQFNTVGELDSAQQWRTVFWKLNVTMLDTLGPYWMTRPLSSNWKTFLKPQSWTNIWGYHWKICLKYIPHSLGNLHSTFSFPGFLLYRAEGFVPAKLCFFFSLCWVFFFQCYLLTQNAQVLVGVSPILPFVGREWLLRF